MGIITQLGGRRFGHLTVVSFVEIRQGNAYWLCHCDCGNESITAAHRLKRGGAQSCGCRQYNGFKRSQLRHGDTVGRKLTREWIAWVKMRDRCNNPKNNRYYCYGAIGVSVCELWNTDYASFLAHVGRKPTPRHTLDRWPNPNGNYEPGNVRWATAKEQANNKRKHTTGTL
jgi:hypothetical protein